MIEHDAWKLLADAENGSVDFVITDPPYGLENPKSLDRSGMGRKDIVTEFDWDEKIPIRDLVHEIARVLKRGGHAIIFFNHRNYSHILDYGEEVGLVPRDPIIFNKSNPAPRLRKVGPSTCLEFAAWLTKSPVSADNYNWQLSQRITNCFTTAIPQAEGSPERHPAQKPLHIAFWLVALMTKPNDLVMDPFAGSGTFLVAAKLLNRKIALAEKDEKWRAVAEQRIEHAMTNKDSLRQLEKFKKEVFSKDKFILEKNEILGIINQKTLLEDWT